MLHKAPCSSRRDGISFYNKNVVSQIRLSCFSVFWIWGKALLQGERRTFLSVLVNFRAVGIGFAALGATNFSMFLPTFGDVGEGRHCEGL